MKNRILILLLVIITSAFNSEAFAARHKKKHKNKAKTTKTVDTKSSEQPKTAEVKITDPKSKEAKNGTTKEQEKTAAVTKVDTVKAKQNTALTQTDSIELYLANSKLKFLKKNAHASYYHSRFDGRRTASGKRFSNNGYTAAHKSLPFGTKVKITNEANGKWVVVEITDRGPFSKVREIDLSKRAFMEIVSNKNSGMAIVTIEVIEPKK